MAGFRWRKSSYSGSDHKDGECVIVGYPERLVDAEGIGGTEVPGPDVTSPEGFDGVAIGDSKDPHGGVFLLSKSGLAGLLDAVRAGRI